MTPPTVTIRIHHSITETDFGDRHSWQSSVLVTAHDDEPTVRRMTLDVIQDLASHDIACVIVESMGRIPFPEEW